VLMCVFVLDGQPIDYGGIEPPDAAPGEPGEVPGEEMDDGGNATDAGIDVVYGHMDGIDILMRVVKCAF